MAYEWRNDGEPVDGEYIVDVDAEDGSQVQTFKGATKDEVTEKLLAAQVNASRRINELKKEVSPDPKAARAQFSPRTLTADERFEISQDLQDPDKAPEAVNKIVEAQLGAPLDVVRNKLQGDDDQRFIQLAAAAADAFVASTPEWNPTPENKLALWNYMEENDLEFTTKNFRIAFDRLTESGLLTARPEPIDDKPEETAMGRIVPSHSTRPRGSFGATGVRSKDVGSTAAPKPKPKYSKQEIDNMPKAVYAHKLTNEAGFAELVNRLG